MELGERWLLDALAGLLGVFGCLVLVLGGQVVGSPYGRYSSQWMGWRLPARPAWVLQELPSLVLPLLECARGDGHLRCWPNALLMAMFLVHYAHRSLIFPFLIRSGTPMPSYTCALAFVFCACNGYLQSRYLSRYAEYAEDWVTDPRFLTGFAMWLVGMLINIHSDHILRNLRKPGETGYKIPR
ncbi:3-oxo-5-alpha-steroid 4-dehydrogenase 1, partial [Orycteropus afer afer]|uniref:3-oxo-5-alpha-steroid 4-dehydrogenase 1 n=1 Tax=Orycteropus afer afer TaxID=1230840 RepID=A0A8B7AV18_ORYAF